MDGELPGDQARFLLRRIDGDPELAQCWSRYQLAGAALRREALGAAPAAGIASAGMNELRESEPGFSHGVSRALRWMGGGAIAAAVAVVSLVATRPQDVSRPTPTTMIASAPSAAAPIPMSPMPAQSPIDLRAPIMAPLPVTNADFAQPASYDSLLPISPYASYNSKSPLQRYAPYLLFKQAPGPAAQRASATRIQVPSQHD